MSRRPETAVLRTVLLEDGDQCILHDDVPSSWRPGNRVALLVHGLAGDHASPYMVRIAGKLNAQGVRAFRMDLRGCGAGFGLARHPYHSGRSDDLARAIDVVNQLCPNSPLSLLGFSLGANIVLKLLGEAPDRVPANLDRVLAVSPPVDLYHCVQYMGQGLNRLYDRHFARLLIRQVKALKQKLPEAPDLPRGCLPRGVFDFDEMFTAPVCGFKTALNYYRLCSSAQFVPEIRVPTLIMAANDDPLVHSSTYDDLVVPRSVKLQVHRSGGHLGFISRRKEVGDRHWMDRRAVEWAMGATPN